MKQVSIFKIFDSFFQIKLRSPWIFNKIEVFFHIQKYGGHLSYFLQVLLRLNPNVAEALPYCCGGFTLLLRRLYTNVAEAICVLLSIIISNQQNFIEFLVGLWQFSKSLAINSGFK